MGVQEQAGSRGGGAGVNTGKQQVSRKLGVSVTVALHNPASTKAMGEASRMPTGCSFQERKNSTLQM